MDRNRILLVLSGPIAVGKTTIANNLENKYGFKKIRTGEYLRCLLTQQGLINGRTALQELGDYLDIQTNFKWVITEVAKPAILKSPEQERWIFDSIRKPEQILLFRAEFGQQIRHLHFTASEGTLRNRYNNRSFSGGINDVEYDTAVNHQNEVIARSLASIADQLINMDEINPDELAELIMLDLLRE